MKFYKGTQAVGVEEAPHINCVMLGSGNGYLGLQFLRALDWGHSNKSNTVTTKFDVNEQNMTLNLSNYSGTDMVTGNYRKLNTMNLAHVDVFMIMINNDLYDAHLEFSRAVDIVNQIHQQPNLSRKKIVMVTNGVAVAIEYAVNEYINPKRPSDSLVDTYSVNSDSSDDLTNTLEAILQAHMPNKEIKLHETLNMSYNPYSNK